MKVICYQMINIIKLVRRLIDEEMRTAGVTRTGWQVLFWLRRLSSCTQKELLQHMDIDAAQLARILDDLEKKNYIVRSQQQGDRRCLVIDMTQHCQNNIMPHVERTIAKENAVLSKGLSSTEMTKLQQLLAKLEKNLEEYHYG